MKSARESAMVFIECEKELLYQLAAAIPRSHPAYRTTIINILNRLHELETH